MEKMELHDHFTFFGGHMAIRFVSSQFEKNHCFNVKKKHNSTLLFHFLLLFGLIFYFRTYRISKSVVRMNKNQSQWYTGSRDATQGPTLVHFTISLRIHPGKRI